MQKTLDEVLAEAAIRDIQMRYCRGADRMDFDLMRNCFHADATLHYGFFVGGVDEFIAMGAEMLKTYAGTTHFTGNQLFEVKGDKAWAEHYTVATHRFPADENGPAREFITSIRYVDNLEQRDGDWRIAKRVLIVDGVRMDPIDPNPNPGVQGGRRDKTDVSYSLLIAGA
jgi:hypothetical protein